LISSSIRLLRLGDNKVTFMVFKIQLGLLLLTSLTTVLKDKGTQLSSWLRKQANLLAYPLYFNDTEPK